ncbi:PDF receptor [Patella vulgata]|uniref:PDF receptor n=1 Tax=Patella vulgata TaxID=6465 RepID=UPI0021803034|nr:PDF receptor [Patella vulgata]
MEFKQDTGAHLGNSLEDCLDALGNFYELGYPPGKFCNVTFDGILCWPPTLAGSTIRQACPTFNSEGFYAYKSCNKDGTWAVIGDPVDLPGLDNSAGFTDYTQCLTIATLETSTTSEEAVSSDFHRAMRIGEILQFILSSVSIVSCLIAILFYIIIARKGMRCRVVIPLFLSVMMYHMMSLVAMTLRHTDKSEDEVHRRDYFCKLEIIILKYSETAIYSWLMVLAIFYHLKALRSPVTCTAMCVMYVIGLGIPIVTTGTWYLCVTFLIEMDNSCFVNFLSHPSIWLTVTPKFLCIMVTFCMLVVCCYAFFRYGDNGHAEQLGDILVARQGTHRAFMVSMILTTLELYLLVSDFSKGIPGMDEYTTHYFLWIVCMRTRGLFLAIFLCFVDKEIWSCQLSTLESSQDNIKSSREHKKNNICTTTIEDFDDLFTDDDIP